MNNRIKQMLLGGILALVVATPLATASRPAGTKPKINVTRAQKLYKQNGCAQCHKVRGLPGGGSMGPDLSRVGRRLKAAEIARYIKQPKAVNPKTKMPPTHLKPADLKTLSNWLASLK
ncbi:MAG: cytochrome c [Armatimonadetes bacterium]|nr:cytochrome c [Armatimonadota bacterium]